MNKHFYLITAFMATCASSVLAFDGNGSGTSDNPYVIETKEQLQSIKDEPTACYRLAADIDLTDFAWESFDFSGILDGNGHEIQYLTILAGNDGTGMFSNFNRPGEIKNLTIRNFDITAGNWSGCLVGTSGNWEASKNGGTVINCRAIDCSINGGSHLGIFAGVTGGLYLENCAAINCNVAGAGNIGGLMGDAEKNASWKFGAYDCAYFGSITAGGDATGGIIGFINTGSGLDIKNCVVYGDFTTTGKMMGGLYGQTNWNTTGSVVDNCASFANIQGDVVGGLVGYTEGLKMTNSYAAGNIRATTPSDQGSLWSAGMVARMSYSGQGYVKNGYFSGTTEAVGDGAYVGALFGQKNNTAITKLYFNTEGSTLALADLTDPATFDITGMLADQMKSLSNYEFEDMSAWTIKEGETTPYLAVQTAPVEVTTCNIEGIEGTCEDGTTEMFLIDESAYFTLDVPVTIKDGKFKAEFPTDYVLDGEQLAIIAKSGGKMWSPVIRVKVDESTGTGIEGIEQNEQTQDNVIYNIQGVKVNKPARGIYIQGGKKFVVK